VLASTVAYTLWWGSQCGMWAWLVLAWAAWLAVTARAGLRVAGRAATVATVIGLAAVAAAGATAAATEKPDQHVALYRPLARIAARLDRAIPSGTTVRLNGMLDGRTQPLKPAVRYFLARRGIRVLSDGARSRNGDWYELDHRPYALTLDMTDVDHRPRHMTLLVRVAFSELGVPHQAFVWIASTRRAR
jgi:hypothetical protein